LAADATVAALSRYISLMVARDAKRKHHPLLKWFKGQARTLKRASVKFYQERTLAAVNICFIIMASLFSLYLQGVSNPSLTMKQTIAMPTVPPRGSATHQNGPGYI
jgi:hypothetical protein